MSGMRTQKREKQSRARNLPVRDCRLARNKNRSPGRKLTKPREGSGAAGVFRCHCRVCRLGNGRENPESAKRNDVGLR
jgi:hypothetical protein